MNTRKSKSLIAAIVGLTLALSLVVGVGSASALTAADIDLLAALGIISPDKVAAAKAALGGSTTTTTSGYQFNTNLTVGSRGADVTALQNLLGVSPATGYFGSITKAAVIKYQLANGISPAAGYVGAITRGKLNAGSSSSTGGTVVIPSGSTLNVSLAASSPVSGAIVAGQAAAGLLDVTFTNTSATPAVVTNVTLARLGVSADTTLSAVYLYDGAMRLTDSATVSSGKITFNSGAGLFTVPAGSSKTISVKSDILSGTNGQLIAVSLTGVSATVPVSAVFPISGASMNIFTASDIASTTIGDASTSIGTSIQAGTLNATVWSAPLTVSQRAVYLKSAAFKVIGSAPSDALQNWKLYASGIQVASASGVDANGYVTFDLTSAPYKIDSSRTLEVRADVVKGSSRTYQVSVQNAGDLMLIDSNYNVGLAVSGTFPESAATVTISAGSVTVTEDTTLSSGNVVTGASNVPLARYNFKAYGEDMKVSYLKVSSNVQLDNVALYANGVQIGSTQTIAATGTSNPKTYSLGSSLIIPAGQTVSVEVRADMKYNGTNIATSTTVQATLVTYTNAAQGSFSSTLVDVPSANDAGPSLTIAGVGLTVAKNAAVANYTTIPNTTAQRIGSFVLSANSNEAARITSLTVALGGSAATSTMSNLYVAVAGMNPTTPVNPQNTNNFSVDFTVPANTSKVVDVFADLGANSGAASTTLSVSGYGVGSNITISSSVTGQTVTIGAGSLAVPTKKTGSGYTPDAQFVVGDSTQTLAYYNFISTNGTSKVTEMTFSATGTSVANSDSPITEVTVGGVTGPVVSGSVTISGLSLDIPVGYAGTNVPVVVKYNTVGLGGITSNLTAGLVLTGYKYVAGGSETSTTTVSVTTNNMTVVGSKPTVSIANPADTSVGTGGSVVVARVTVSADAKGPITLLTLPITVQTSGAAGATATNIGTTGTVKVGGSTITTTGGLSSATTTASTTAIVFTGGYEIAAGSSVTFDIYGTLGLTDTTDSVRTSVASSTAFTWKDVVGNVTGITGSLIYNYPTNTAIVAY